MKKCESCIAWGFRSDADMWQDNPECLFFGLGGEDSCEFTEDDTKAILRGAKNPDLVLVAVPKEKVALYKVLAKYEKAWETLSIHNEESR